MKKLILTLALAFSLSAAVNAQSKKELVADQTVMVETKTAIKLVTSNEYIFQQFSTKMVSTLKSYSVKFVIDKRTQERYKEYTLVYPLEFRPEISEYATELNHNIKK